MAIVSLSFLMFAVFVGFLRKLNPGLISLGLSLILVYITDLSEKDILTGFNHSLLLMLMGVTYLFSIAQSNGTLAGLARNTVALAGSNTALVPVIIYVFSLVLSAIGPGTIPTMAVMMVFSMSIAVEMKINPAMLSALVTLGSCAGGLSPIAATGLIASDLSHKIGLLGNELPLLVNAVGSMTILAIIIYLAFGGHKLQDGSHRHVLHHFSQKQILTLAAMVILVIAVLGFRLNVGYVSFTLAMILTVLRVGDEASSVRLIPWPTMIMILGVGVLVSLVVKLGGVELLTAILSMVMTENNAPSILGIMSGALSWVSSSSGVVMPTFYPAIPSILARVGGNVNPAELANAICICSHTAAISPISTGGALSLAAYCTAAKSRRFYSHIPK